MAKYCRIVTGRIGIKARYPDKVKYNAESNSSLVKLSGKRQRILFERTPTFSEKFDFTERA